jgi:hypothetical protein
MAIKKTKRVASLPKFQFTMGATGPSGALTYDQSFLRDRPNIPAGVGVSLNTIFTTLRRLANESSFLRPYLKRNRNRRVAP